MKKILRLLLIAVLLTSLCAACASCGKGNAAMDSEPFRPAEKLDSQDMSLSFSSAEGSEAQSAQKLIRTVGIYAETKDFDDAVAAIKQRIAECGGYVEEMNLRAAGTRSFRSLTLSARIPAEQLDAFTGGLSERLHVLSVSQTAENVTQEYFDVEAKLETLKTERKSLLEMMDSLNTAQDYNFWFTLHTRLTELEKEIASYEAIIKNYDSLVAYSTVDLDLNEVLELEPEEQPTFGERIGTAFRDSWKRFAEGWKNFAVGFVDAFPTLLTVALILGLLGLIPLFIVRGVKKKHRRQSNG